MKLNYFQWMPGFLNSNAPLPAVPLVFLHGMGGTGQIWRPIGAQLEDHFRCIALDQRGHGASRPVPGAPPSFHSLDYANDVLETLDALAVDEFYVIGHSMGVRTALALAHLAPERIRGLIAVDLGISSEWGGGIGLPLSNFLKDLPTTFPNRAELKDYLLKHCPDPAIAQYLSAVSKKISDAPETWNFPFDHEALVQTIEQANDAPLGEWVIHSVANGVKMHFLRGENSKVWLKADYEAQKAKYEREGLSFEEWPNCGHGLPFEQRAKFVDYVKTIAADAKITPT